MPRQSQPNQQEKLIQTKIQKKHAKPKAQGFRVNDPVEFWAQWLTTEKLNYTDLASRAKSRGKPRFPKVKVKISWGVLGEMTFRAVFAEYLRFQTKAYLYYESIHHP